MWFAVGAVIVVALVRSHRLTETSLIVFCALVPSIILHEVAHGVVAFALGDDTARRAGRLTLRPGPHVDPLGTVIVPIVTVLAGWGFFGWAKPVPVSVNRLRNPRNHHVLVALAGPVTNALLATAAGVLFVELHGNVALFGGALWARVIYLVGLVNVWVAAFNLVPVPPLDGSVVLERMLPAPWWPSYLRIRQYALPVLVGGLLLLAMVQVYPTEPLLVHLQLWWAHLVQL